MNVTQRKATDNVQNWHYHPPSYWHVGLTFGPSFELLRQHTLGSAVTEMSRIATVCHTDRNQSPLESLGGIT